MAAVTGAVIAGASVVAGAYSSSQARGDARDAARRQEGAAADQAGIAREQLDFGRQQYADWREMFQPAMMDLRNLAYEQREPDYAAIGADVGAAFDTSQGITRRQQQRYGLQPGDGAVQEGELRYGMGRALATVDGRNRARVANRDTQWNRLASFANLGNGQQANAQNTMNQGFGAMGNAFGNQANMFGNQAAGYGQAAAAGAQMMGYGVNQLANYNWSQFGNGGNTGMGPSPAGPYG